MLRYVSAQKISYTQLETFEKKIEVRKVIWFVWLELRDSTVVYQWCHFNFRYITDFIEPKVIKLI